LAPEFVLYQSRENTLVVTVSETIGDVTVEAGMIRLGGGDASVKEER